MNILEKLYTDPETGFVGREQLYKKAKEIDKSITRKDVNNFFESSTTTQLLHQVAKPTNMPILGNVGFYQGDLIFYPKYKKQNRGFSGAFIAVGINSRYAYGFPFKTKTADEIYDILEAFIERAKKDERPIMALETDNGSEFLNKRVQQLLIDNGINHITFDVGNHRALGRIDRFSRTIKSYITRYMIQNNTTNWIDVFEILIRNYNNTYHSAIDMKPKDVSPKKEREILDETFARSLDMISTKDLKKGDYVRVPLIQKSFDKEGQKYSNKVYIVDSIGFNKVSIRDLDGDLVNKRYNINQLLKVPKESTIVQTSNIDQAKMDDRVRRVVEQKEGIEVATEPRRYTTRQTLMNLKIRDRN